MDLQQANQQRPRPTATVNALGRRILGELQGAFPIEERPYQVVADRLGITEAEAFGSLTEARASGQVRQVGAIFDTKSLGYASSLVAMRVAEDALPRAVSVVNAHPGVSHNYLRDHEFNLWFTIATRPPDRLEDVLQEILRLSTAQSMRVLPTLRLFKIGVNLDAAGHLHEGVETASWYSEERQQQIPSGTLTGVDIQLIRAAQEDLGGEIDPFAAIGRALAIPTAEVVTRLRSMAATGVLRRFAVILNHRRSGLTANGMAAWAVPEERIDEVGRFFARQRCVSHCYQRPSYPDWPYNILTMIHGGDRSEVQQAVERLAADAGIADVRVLYSTTEFKKVRLRYFMPEERQWLSLCEAAAQSAGPAPAFLT